jgi:sialic acid synthase SpsE
MYVKFSDFDKVMVVAEIGNNHEGSAEVALELIECAAKAGVDAVKFQTFIPEYYVSSADEHRLQRLNQFRLQSSDYSMLAKRAMDLGLLFFSTPFDLQSANFLDELQSFFKISSGDNSFYPLIKRVAQFAKPTMISTGLSDNLHLDYLYKYWVDVGGSIDDLCFMHCVSSYPTPNNQANIAAISALIQRFPKIIIGYSDHTEGIQVPILAVAAGAKIIEKHFTLSKHYSDFRDHQLSADPKEMADMVVKIQEVASIMGDGVKKIQPCEIEMQLPMRRSIAASRNLDAGTLLCSEDLIWVRPGVGFSPGMESAVIGRSLRVSLKLGEIIMKEHLV